VTDSPWVSIRADHRTLTTATGDALREAIQQDRFPAGSQLPPELELMAMLNVSRTTLREALRTLEEQGFIERRRGKGTYVRPRSIVKDLSINFGISEMITQAGLIPGSQVTLIRREPAAAAVAAALQINEGAEVIIADRVRTANERPVVWSLDFLSAALFGDRALLAEHLDTRSLYQYLSEELQIRIVRGIARLSPVAATAEIAERLSVRRGTPLQYILQTDYTAGDQPVLYSMEYHVSDAFVFVINRRGPSW
jgi:GntR family transcriptional regulator